MSNPIIRKKLDAGEFFVAPGLQDMMAATVADKVGFDIVYASGYWLTASCYGLPDAGIATYTQMLDRVSTLAGKVDAALIADADTGYGGLLNVHHTVRGYEAAGCFGDPDRGSGVPEEMRAHAEQTRRAAGGYGRKDQSRSRRARR